MRCGFTAAGTQRWRCSACNAVRIRKRPDTAVRNRQLLKERWLAGHETLSGIGKRLGRHRTMLARQFRTLPDRARRIPLRQVAGVVLVVDGIRLAEGCDALIAHDALSGQPLAWSFSVRERYASWHALLSHIRNAHEVLGIVSDGQKGLKKAIRELIPEVPHQRCIAHVTRLSRAWLTRHPRSIAGAELLALIRCLGCARTVPEADAWADAFLQWQARHLEFLREKSLNPETGRAWYTHRRLRAMRSLVKNALPDLFRFIDDARLPNTTNHVEGGINAEIARLLDRHRGTTLARRRMLVSAFLFKKRRTSSTRNAT